LEVAGSVSCQFLSKRKESPVRGDGMFVLIPIAPHGALYLSVLFQAANAASYYYYPVAPYQGLHVSLSVDFNRLCHPTAELIFFVGDADGIARKKRA
jgi:hypothetical protein